jgi:hypothetical protein
MFKHCYCGCGRDGDGVDRNWAEPRWFKVVNYDRSREQCRPCGLETESLLADLHFNLTGMGKAMKDERLCVPIDDAYLHAVGLATICFARLEWNAAWCCEKMHQGYLDDVGTRTAGQIANDLVAMAAAHKDHAVLASLGPPAEVFKKLVGTRNDLVHANPGTATNGNQRLFRKGAEWTIDLINHAADEFAEASEPLNYHIHNVL